MNRILLLIVPLLIGCGHSTGGLGSPAGISGTVQVAAGQPLPHGVVEFQALNDRTLARQARIVGGNFSLDERQGLRAGDYAVRVLPFEPEAEELGQFSDEERQAIRQARTLIPPRFQQAQALSVALNAGAANSLKIDLSQ